MVERSQWSGWLGGIGCVLWLWLCVVCAVDTSARGGGQLDPVREREWSRVGT